MNPIERKELLIASVTPQNLERGVLWFAENQEKIKHARNRNLWWHNNTTIIERDLSIKPSELARRILDLNYERTQTVAGPGLFAVRGGIIEIWPISAEKPYLIEFSGNVIASIVVRREIEEQKNVRSKPRKNDTFIPGSFVVHQDHGIGIFKGVFTNGILETRAAGADESPDSFFLIEYAPPSPGREPDKLYVPIDKKERITSYIGFEIPKINRLGGTIWFTAKRKAREDAEKLARSLLELYAKREQAQRNPYYGDAILETKFRETFPYTETEDQLRAEEEIIRDLESERPMDRVLAGDVGFGKTEIALRSALRVIASGKQAAILTPTTILAVQHFETCKKRFDNLPVHIQMLSRLTPAKEIKKILNELKEGKIDLLIGTHRIFSADVVFGRFGLLIIDEEQRFGVKQKEKLKELRTNLDSLSLSATPIPRTLSFTLARLRDISRIDSPPPHRKSIHTFVLPYSRKIVREAIKTEIDRGGQIYFLHNRIETLMSVREKLKKLFSAGKHQHPVRIGIIHGRMNETEAIRIMHQFRDHELDLLLATTIIENGLDISNANMLIVDDATKLGLAQAHQLRGRIGRSDAQGYAYFLYPARAIRKLPAEDEDTEKMGKRRPPGSRAFERLEALKEYASLGAGYDLALRDLEIRGAGNILGREQSGAINKVGINLYYQMLADAVEELKNTAI